MAAAIFTALFLFYLLTMAPGLTFGDSGELAAAAWHLGVAHPPGYPAWVIPARVLASVIPMGSVAFRTNLFSVLLTSGALAVCFSCLGRIGVSSRVSLGIVLLAATTPVLWSASVITEVYALNFLFFSLFMWAIASLQGAEGPGRGRLIMLMALVSGLALCNHTTSLCLVPVWILVSLRQRDFMRSLLAFITGLSLLGAMVLMSASHPAMNWGRPANMSRWLHTVTRAQYGSLSSLPRSLNSLFNDHISLLREIFTLSSAAVVLLCLVVMVFRILRKGDSPKDVSSGDFAKTPWFLFSLYILLTFTSVSILILSPGSAQELHQIRHFFIPVLLPLMILGGLCLKSTVSGETGKSATPVAFMLVGAALFQGFQWFPHCSQRGNDYAVGLYRDVARHAYADKPWEGPVYGVASGYGVMDFRGAFRNVRPRLLILDHDDNYFPLLYAMLCTGDIPPVYPVCRQFAALSWYMEELRENLPGLKLTEFDDPLYRVEAIVHRRTRDIVQENCSQWDISAFLNFRPDFGERWKLMPRGLLFRIVDGNPGLRDINLSLNTLPSDTLNGQALKSRFSMSHVSAAPFHQPPFQPLFGLDQETGKALSYYHLAALNSAAMAISEGEYLRALKFIDECRVFAGFSSARVRDFGTFVEARGLLLSGSAQKALELFDLLEKESAADFLLSEEQKNSSGHAGSMFSSGDSIFEKVVRSSAQREREKSPQWLAPGALDFHRGLCLISLGKRDQGEKLLREAASVGYGRQSFSEGLP
ncbi:MAG: hypothetical protein CVV64_00850 [Candidatus Wallbacteria bacterium HGW-Wallbacteria-1]|jgi:hypothetical protein|uniref:DUF2723 domain-containing protein n=1 Tax=Candidatus Wallbacteria bacterium HGW-Wallbacteria-1 TaxID=2013854 RepID=A0A2N1PUI1_9BACT|nr:MAG: hypothetical protein CVV64_00850 [Candidatus Wallbacteria bacterium HGW-Wallbacteria-1]